MTVATRSRIFVDGNNVMGSRPDGWCRADARADATRRLVADVIPPGIPIRHGGAWTIVFDGKEPPAMPPMRRRQCLTGDPYGT